jgi:hydroxyethylthiazole kinase-like uncharacterized protein yjeF
MVKRTDYFLVDNVTAKNMDQASLNLGFTSRQLMGQAALGIYQQLLFDGIIWHPYFKPNLNLKKKKYSSSRHLWIICGRGNNGGDALNLAYLILSAQKLGGAKFFNPLKIFCEEANTLAENGKFYLSLIKTYFSDSASAQVEICHLHELLKVNKIPKDDKIVIIDGLLGIGLKGPVRTPDLNLIKKINSLPALKISIDLPSGLSDQSIYQDQPTQELNYILPHIIYGIGVPKISLFINPSFIQTKITTIPIGLIDITDLTDFRDGKVTHQIILKKISSLKKIKDYFKKHSQHHKYSAGSALMIAGESGMEGAMMISAKSFLASGSGYLQLLNVDNQAREFILKMDPTFLAKNIFSDLEKFQELESIFKKGRALLIGPGLSSHSILKIAEKLPIQNLLKKVQGKIPIILDAGAIDEKLNFLWGKSTLLTPHSGELKNIGFKFSFSTENLFELRDFVKNTLKSWLLLKDCFSFLISPSGKIWLWRKPLSSLAVMGSGDSLSGILLSAFSKAKYNFKNEFTDLAEEDISDMIFMSLSLQARSAKLLTNPTTQEIINQIKVNLK